MSYCTMCRGGTEMKVLSDQIRELKAERDKYKFETMNLNKAIRALKRELGDATDTKNGFVAILNEQLDRSNAVNDELVKEIAMFEEWCKEHHG